MAKSKSLPNMMELSDALYGTPETSKPKQDDATRPKHHFAGYVKQVVPYEVTKQQLSTWYDSARTIWPDDAEFNHMITYCALLGLHPDRLAEIPLKPPI